jgi:uncharacterized protein (TIGR03437 family)
VFYSSPTQINFLIDAGVASQTATTITIACAGLLSQRATLPVSAAAPALFTVAQNGAGQASCVSQDGSFNAPVALGTVIEL